MIYGSVCSGIEAATAAWHPLGWKASFFSEIEKFPRHVLKHHYPNTPLHGDFTTIGANEYDPIDLLVGGTPCQTFSIAGLGAGLSDDRGNLSLEFIRLAQRKKPRWVLWENVPGVLSNDKGRAFGSILGGLAKCGYGFAYRILDAQYFGVPQRRRRVFVVGYLGDWRPAAAVLFERESLQGDITPSREKGQKVAPTISARTKGGGLGTDFDCDGGLVASTGNVAHCLNAGGMGRQDYETETLIYPINTQIATRHEALGRGTGFGIGEEGDPAFTLQSAHSHAVAFNSTARPDELNLSELVTLTCSQSTATLLQMQVRRFTPRECERLQGFPDIKKCAIISVWFTDNQKNDALAAISNLKSQESVINADTNVSPQNVWSAGDLSHTNLPCLEKPAVLSVHINLEHKEVQILNQEKSLLFASTAGKQSSFHPRILIEDFVHLVALMPKELGRKVQTGKAESPPNIKHFSQGLNGRTFATASGREIEEAASDAEKFTTKLNQCFTSITSGAGLNSQNSASAWETWCCCVLTAINSFIPEETRNGNLYSVSIETSQGYTKISAKTSDGTRYKALGNSMAVPVMHWLGQRIQMVEDLIKTTHP